MIKNIHASISTASLDPQAALDFVGDDANGAALLFIGAVRNHNLNRPVEGVTYDCHPELATTILREIATEAQSQTTPDLRVFVSHFSGFLPINGISVVIATASPHRDDAYVANRYIIEQIKLRLPVWKHEHYTDGQAAWLEGTPITKAF